MSLSLRAGTCGLGEQQCMSGTSFGLLLVLAAGLLNSVYAVLVRRMPRWEFENLWLIYSVVGMGILGWAVA